MKDERKNILNADQLRGLQPSSLSGGRSRQIKTGKRNDIYIVLDDVLDTYNIGSIFRLADAVAAKKIYLCGETEIPPNPRIKKASINTTEVVNWEYSSTVIEVVESLKLKVKNLKVVAIEQSIKSVPYNKFEYKLPVCLIVGHESDGVSKEVLDMADGIVELPMFGVNKSLNVMVSLGIVLYQVIEDTGSA